jgi:plasmid segregation protein ParM
MANKKATARSGAPTINVGIDAGYGATKAVMQGVAPVIFPSVYGYAVNIAYQAAEIAQKYPGDQITDEGRDWFVGGLAMSQLREGELMRLRGRSGTNDDVGVEVRLRLIKAALGKLLGGTVTNGDMVAIRLATGLPVAHMRTPAIKTLKNALIGTHQIQTDVANFVACITDVMVMPQPTGALYSQQITSTGEINRAHTSKRTGMIDVGKYTIDDTLDDDGEYLTQRSGSVEGGVHVVDERLADMLTDEMGDTPEYWQVEQVLRTGKLRIRGEERSFSKQVRQFCEALDTATINLSTQLWGAGAGIDVIYVCGGGGPLVIDRVREVYPQAVLVENPQLSIAQGYLNYAMMTAETR